MEPKYRGISYEHNPSAFELTEGETGGKYQGTNSSHRYLKHIPVPQPVADLKYRGVANSTAHPVDVEASLLPECAKAEAATAAAAIAGNELKQSRLEVMNELNNIHLNNLRRNLERRLQAAKARGDQDLIRLLEAEAQQLV